MDKLDYTPDEAAEFDLIARTAPVGYVGIVTPDGYPRVVPMNSVVYTARSCSSTSTGPAPR